MAQPRYKPPRKPMTLSLSFSKRSWREYAPAAAALLVPILLAGLVVWWINYDPGMDAMYNREDRPDARLCVDAHLRRGQADHDGRVHLGWANESVDLNLVREWDILRVTADRGKHQVIVEVIHEPAPNYRPRRDLIELTLDPYAETSAAAHGYGIASAQLRRSDPN